MGLTLPASISCTGNKYQHTFIKIQKLHHCSSACCFPCDHVFMVIMIAISIVLNLLTHVFKKTTTKANINNSHSFGKRSRKKYELLTSTPF